MKVFAENRKARNSYEFLDFYEAGVVLSGPETCGIGGDLFALIWVPGKNKPEFLDASGYSGSKVDLGLLSGYKNIPLNHPLSVTVPGAVAGWRELSNKYGNIPINDKFY